MWCFMKLEQTQTCFFGMRLFETFQFNNLKHVWTKTRVDHSGSDLVQSQFRICTDLVQYWFSTVLILVQSWFRFVFVLIQSWYSPGLDMVQAWFGTAKQTQFRPCAVQAQSCYCPCVVVVYIGLAQFWFRFSLDPLSSVCSPG